MHSRILHHVIIALLRLFDFTYCILCLAILVLLRLSPEEPSLKIVHEILLIQYFSQLHLTMQSS